MSASLRCRKCSQRIASDEEFLYDGERPLHLECYTCFHCHQSLAGQFYYRYRDPQQDGKRQSYCDRCYFRLAPVCFYCLKIIDEISLMYGEKTFHPNCFLCHRCESPFKGALAFPYKDHVYCAKCYTLAQNDFHPAASHLLTERCSICRKPFQPGDLITKHRIEGSTDNTNEIVYYMHNGCFVCDICHRNLSNSIYYSPNDPNETNEQLAFQCEQCHQRSTSLCSSCFRPSDDEMVIYNQHWYHEHCFICKKCHFRLKNSPRIIVESDGFLCERCLKLSRDQEELKEKVMNK